MARGLGLLSRQGNTARRVRPFAWGVVLLLGLGLAQTYTVLPGDTLHSIARKYGTTVEELMWLNDLTTSRLEVGQVLRLPSQGSPLDVQVLPSRGSTEKKQQPDESSQVVLHTVLPGDTLYSIARKYGTTVEELQRLNGLDGSLLKVGQVLHIPLKAQQAASPEGEHQVIPPLDQEEDPGVAVFPEEERGVAFPSGKHHDELPWESPLLRAVLKYLGVPYKYGANSPLALDCSAFVAQVYRELGYALPRTSKEQHAALSPVDKPLPGDLVFFSFSGRQIDHVGLYLGRGVFAHASSYGSRVVIESLEAPVYKRAYQGARRLPGFSVWGAPPVAFPSGKHHEAAKGQETPPR